MAKKLSQSVATNKIIPWFQREIFLLIIVIVLSAGTHFAFFNYPNQIVFDELHFANFITNHLAGTYYFDIHPPLAKIILAESAKLVGLTPDFNFEYEKIGKEYSHPEFYEFTRFVVTFFGFLLPLCLYFLARELFRDKWISFLTAFLAIFENALLVHTRYILTDVFLLDFGILGLAFLLMHLRRHSQQKFRFPSLFLAGIFLGGALSVKWTGLVFPGLAGLILLYVLAQSKDFLVFVTRSAILGSMIFVVYFASFAWHLHSLDKSGPGDAFMSQGFQATLQGNANADNAELVRPNLYQKFIELNKQMYKSNKGITSEHAYGSKWYSWPFMQRTVYYWNQKADDQDATSNKEHRIYLLGNPVIWWTGALIIFFFTISWFVHPLLPNKENHGFALAVILIGFWSNLLPYIPISRVSFLYHYFPSLLFLMIGIAYFFRKYFSEQNKVYVTIGFLGLVVISYLYFSPLTYGIALSPAQFDARMWLGSWR